MLDYENDDTPFGVFETVAVFIFDTDFTGKCTRIEILLLTHLGLQPVLDVPIYGRIATLKLFRPHIRFSVYFNREIQVLCLQWDVESQELITKVMGDVSDHIGRPTDSGQVIPFDNKGQLKEAFIIRLEELQVLDITFLYGCSKPTIVVLYLDNKDARHLKYMSPSQEPMERWMQMKEKVTGLKIELLGKTSIASTISYLDNAFVYFGSSYGDSQLVKLNLQLDAKGSYVEVLERYVNLGPIVDFCVVDLERQGQGQVVTCSGAYKDGSLRVVLNGIGINEQASVELQGIKGMWSLRSSTDDLHDFFLVVSFISETRILAMNIEDELEETEIQGFSSQVQTLFCHDAVFNQLVQVTSSSVRLVSSTSRDLEHEWHAPAGYSINVATANVTQVLLATGGKHLVYLEIGDGVLIEKKYVQMDFEISCLDINPIGENPNYSQLAAVGRWTDISVQIYSLPDLNCITKEHLGGEIIPRSVLLCTSEGISYLLCALGDGHLLNFTLNATTGELTDRKKVSLGTQPFAASDRPTVIYSSNKKLLYSNVNLKEVSHMCPFNSAAFPDRLAIAKEGELTIGTIDDIQKLHIRSIPLGEHAPYLPSGAVQDLCNM
ncbi:hypothetical protein M0R45_000357 [Rubus argutus]|uniref:DNA damage-binding protein 1 n=1 Tax=Rubus argutus TaxID=59490 RepID=A0AAW1VKY1_RUBAR